MYEAFYHKALETIISNIKQRFEQTGYKMVVQFKNLLLKCAMNENYEEEFKLATDFYGSDLNKDDLETQLHVMFKEFKTGKVHLEDVIEFMSKNGYSDLLSEVSTVLRLILVLPASNAQPERVFSVLKHTKTPIRNSMDQDRLNSLMILNIHKKETKGLNLVNIANDFVSAVPGRKNDFGDKKFI